MKKQTLLIAMIAVVAVPLAVLAARAAGRSVLLRECNIT